MFVKWVVNFKVTPPTIEMLRQKINEITGLSVKLNENGNAFIHQDFADKGFNFYHEGNTTICITTGWNETWYLLEATLAALVSLGGECDYRINDWAWKRWDEVKLNPPRFELG